MTDAPAGSEARRAARNVSALALARVVSSGALFVWQLSLGRLLGDAQFGVYGTIGSLYSIFASLTSFALGLIIIREVARRPSTAGKYITAALFIQTILAGVGYIVLNGAALALGYDEGLRGLAAIAALSLFLDLVGNIAYDQLLAHERMVSVSFVEIGVLLARIALGLGLVAAGFGLLGVYIATLLTGLLRSALLMRLLTGAGVHAVWPLDRGVVRLLLIAAAPLALSSVINMSYTQIDRLMSTSLLTTADTGHFSAAFVIIVGVVEILSTTVLVALFPLMSRAYKPDVPREQNTSFYFMVEKLAFFALCIGLPVALVLTVFASAVTVPVFGEDFLPSADILRVLIWYAALTMVANVFAQAMMSENRQGRYVAIRAGGLAVKLALNLALIPALGVIGAAAASALAELAVLAVLMGHFRLNLRARAGQFIRLGLVCAAMLAVMLALSGLPLIAMLAGGLVYAAGVLFGGALAGDDYDLLYRMAAALPFGGLVRRFWKRKTVVTWE
ncbi:MAG: oligosaccharide flippase family protein [Pleurocapsa minor GSE-CHR-MK-17-07R]|nr:oligosaccharide flippase family protein [Pleurocapsa minor GSE-CHR-MK 17-07R]